VSFEPTTLIFETVNFLVLVFLLWRILYRPLRRGIAARRQRIADDLAQAAHAREQAEDLEAAWRRREEELAEIRAEARRRALEDADRERAALLARAREAADAERARVSQLLETERRAAARWVHAAVWSQATELAGRLVLAFAPDDFDRILWDRLIQVVRDRREELGRGDGELDAEVRGARMADPAQVEALRDLVEELLGHRPRVSVREDDALRAGWVVRIGDRVFDGSLEGELEAFRALAPATADEAA